jgi:hypothetical protein
VSRQKKVEILFGQAKSDKRIFVSFVSRQKKVDILFGQAKLTKEYSYQKKGKKNLHSRFCHLLFSFMDLYSCLVDL